MEQLIVFGNPGNRRTEGLQQARAAFGLAPAVVVPYAALLRDGLSLAGLVRANGLHNVPVGLRLDAPGESFEVERELIALGAPDRKLAEDDDRLLPFAERPDPEPWSSRNALAMPEQTGRLYHPSQWFRGFGRLLARLERAAAELCPGSAWWNAPAEVMAMFDKRRTHQVLRAAGVPVPERLAAPDELPDADALRETMLRAGMHRVFVKLAPGSGACGVVAYQINPVTGAERAMTTVGFERHAARPPVLFSTKKVRSYTDGRDIALILNWLLRHGAHVERWIAKAEHGGGTYDIRQLVVAGEACHSVARVSRTPITNLHLRSERMDVNLLGLSLDNLEAVRGCAEQAAAAFPACAVAGIDVLVSRHTHRVYAIDVNPFGDLLYRIAYRGYDAYGWEMRRLCGNRAAETFVETAVRADVGAPSETAAAETIVGAPSEMTAALSTVGAPSETAAAETIVGAPSEMTAALSTVEPPSETTTTVSTVEAPSETSAATTGGPSSETSPATASEAKLPIEWGSEAGLFAKPERGTRG